MYSEPIATAKFANGITAAGSGSRIRASSRSHARLASTTRCVMSPILYTRAPFERREITMAAKSWAYQPRPVSETDAWTAH